MGGGASEEEEDLFLRLETRKSHVTDLNQKSTGLSLNLNPKLPGLPMDAVLPSWLVKVTGGQSPAGL
jgi:hypothetical protein